MTVTSAPRSARYLFALAAFSFGAVGMPLQTLAAPDGNTPLTATKVVANAPVTQGEIVTYTIVIVAGNIVQQDNPGDEFTDVLPANLLVDSASATSGTASVAYPTNTVTWNGALAANASVTISINAVVLAQPGNTVTNQGTLAFDADGNGTNEATGVTDDPAVAGTTNPTSFIVVAVPRLSASKDVAGPFTQGTTVTYTIDIANVGTGTQPDNAGDEFLDVLPPQLTLVSATATAGTAIATIATNTVTWNGALAVEAEVTITIVATIGNGTPSGTEVSNQGTVFFDSDNNGTNESSGVTSDPNVKGTSATIFVVGGGAPAIAVPTHGAFALLILAASMLLLAFARMRRAQVVAQRR